MRHHIGIQSRRVGGDWVDKPGTEAGVMVELEDNRSEKGFLVLTLRVPVMFIHRD